ncbi:MAG: hypothetical protein MJZ20_05715 [Bacteroidaceae bacterium]|nr:hypothetical protein [Bacteroidaceae bacterium]
MNDRMRDYMMDRGYDRNYDRGYDRGDMYDRGYDRAEMDGRNPYGSRGGYVTSRRPRGDRADMDNAYEYEGSFRGGDHNMYDERYMDGRRGYRGRRDYASGRRLDMRELEEWHKKLMSKVPDSSKEMLSEDKIMKKVKEHGIKMDKFTEDEFIVTVIMMFTDYWETAGRGNLDMYVKLAEDFLCDEDAALKGSEKLAAYYDNIVMA